MKRIIATLIAALVLAAGVPAAPAAAADVSQPGLACADINGGSDQSFYAVDATRMAILSVQIRTVKPLCRGATLTVYLTSDATGTTALSFATYPSASGFSACTPAAPGQGCLTYTKSYGNTDTGGTASSAPPNVYVYLQTRFGPRQIDRAPNSGAGTFTLCDLDRTTPDYDSSGNLIPECVFPGGDYFE
jgi:hypothetical protein